jgi:hypothetical protein
MHSLPDRWQPDPALKTWPVTFFKKMNLFLARKTDELLLIRG